jgi:Homeodomain-like domain
VSTAEPDVEDQVRQLAGVGLSTRRIADAIGDVSQSTVVRILQRINSGPQPVILPEKRSSRHSRITIEMVRLGVHVALVITLAVLTAAVATIAWR